MTLRITDRASLKTALAQGKYADGGYPVYYATHAGEALSHDAVHQNIRAVMRATLAKIRGKGYADPEWALFASDINWENPDLWCNHTGERIESAYAEPEPGDESEAEKN